MADNSSTPIINRLNLEKEFGGYQPTKPLDPSASIPFKGLNNNINNNSVDGPSSLERLEMLARSGGRGDGRITGGGIPRTLGESQSERYPNFIPGDYNNEDAYGQGQGWGSKMVSGVGKGLVLTGTTFLQTTAGLVNGVYQASNDGKFSSFYNNEFNRTLDDLNKYLEDKLPNYYTDAEKDAHWYSAKKLFSANFLWDGIIKNLGFAAGAALSGQAFAVGLRAFSALPGLARLVSVGKGASALAASGEASIIGAANTASTFGKVASLSKNVKNAYNVLTPGGRALVAGLATTGEAGIEAFHNMNEFRDKLIANYEAENGTSPVGQDLADIDDAAAHVGNRSFVLNMGLLSVTNYVQFPKILGSSYKAEKGAINSRTIRNVIKKEGQYVEKPLFKNKILDKLNRARPYFFSVTEAFEEGSQFAITMGTQDYYDKQYNNEEKVSLLENVTGGIKENFDEFMENVLIGGLSGSIMLGRGRYRQDVAKSKNTAAAVTAFNKHKLSDFTNDTLSSSVRGITLQQEREEMLKQGNISDSKDLEADYIINYLTPRVKYGRGDLVTAEIEDVRTLASTEEGFAQLVAEGKALESDTREAYLDRINSLEQTFENVKSLYQSLTIRYSGQVDEDGKLLYTDDVIDKMVYAASKIADYDVRIPQLTSNLIGAVENIDQVLQDVFEGKDELYDAALTKLEATNSTTKDEHIQDLKDAAKLTTRRKQFLTEYQDIKDKPKKHQELKTTSGAVPPEGEDEVQTITIKTKSGEKNIEIGTEYFLGRVVKYDENGHEVYRAPKIKVLAKNEDGTIKIQDSTGKVRDISAEEFEGYKLGKVSSTLSNKKAKFYMENWNTIFEHKGLKDKNGKPRRGRLEYDQEGDAMVFVFKNDKGQVRRYNVTNKQFVTAKGFNKPMVEAVGELTPVQQASLEELALAKEIDNAKNREARLNILTELFDEVSGKQTVIEKLLDKKKNELANIQEGLVKLKDQLLKSKDDVDKRVKSAIRFKSATRKAMAASLRLTRMQEQLENEISELEVQKEDMENTLFQITDMAENIDLMPIGSSEFLEELNDSVLDLEVLAEETVKQINSLHKLVDSVKDTIDSAIDFLSDLINDFKAKYPKVPTVMGQEWIDFLKANPNFLKRKPNYKEDLKEVEEIVAQTEDTDITINEKKLDVLNSQLDDLQEQLKQTDAAIRAKSEILQKFEDTVNEYKKQKQDEAAVKASEELHDRFLGSMDKSVQNKHDNPNYEADSKKNAVEVVTSTKPATGQGGEVLREHHNRSNRFGFRLPKLKNRKSLRGLTVTSKTEGDVIPGLTKHLIGESGLNPETVIALVITDEFGSPVDENGVVIPEKSESESFEDYNKRLLDEGVYQVFPEKLTAKYSDGVGSMFRKGVDEKTVTQLTNKFTAWRNHQLQQSKIGTPQPIDVSFGNVENVTHKNETGEEVEDFDARIPVTDVGLITLSQLSGEPIIDVHTTNKHSYTHGKSTFLDALGRVFLKVENGAIRLLNRTFNAKEATVIFDVMVQVSENAITSIDESLSQEARDVAKAKNDRLYKWLRSVIHWGIPKDQDGKRKKAAYNSIWFEKVTEENKTYTKLFISKNGEGFDFTPSSLQQNKSEILEILQDLYGNTDASLVRAENFNNPYWQITGIDANGEPLTEEWKNYQTFLLSPKDRNAADIPLTTRMRPVKDENDTNRKGIYFTVNAYEDFYKAKPKPAEEKKTEEAPKEKASTAPVLDGVTENSITLGKYGTTTYKLDGQKYVDTKGKEGFTPTFDGNLVEAVMTGLSKTKEEAFNIIAGNIIKSVQPQLDALAVNQVKDDPIDPVDKSTENEFYDDSADDTSEDSDYRLTLANQANKFEGENWKKLEKWLKANFPNVPVYRVKNIIQATNGRQAWGMLHQGAIYVYEGAEIGTAYHEVFEAVWKMFADPTEKTNITNEFKSREGSYVDRVTGETIQYKDTTDSQLKEELAEEFRDYILQNKIAPKVKGKSWIARIFYDIKRFINEFFTGKNAQENTEKLFEKIGTGYYSQYNPFASQLSNANVGVIDIDNVHADRTSEFSMIKNIPAAQVHEVIQHMTYTVLVDLIENNESLFTIPHINKKELYKKLRQAVNARIRDKRRQYEKAAAEGEITKEIAGREVGKLLSLYANIKSQWAEIVKKHEEQLMSYNIQFDENDELELRNDEKGKSTPYGNPTKIDAFRKANGAIKLLLATLPNTELVGNRVKIKRSSIGGVTLIPVDKAYISIKNKLYDSVDLDDMLDKLAAIAVADPNYARLYRRLTNNPPSRAVDYSKLDDEGLHLIAAFWKSMKSQNPDVLSVFQLPTGEVIVSDSNLSSASKQSKREFINQMIDVIKDGVPYFSYNAKTGEYNPTDKVKDLELKGSELEGYVKFLNVLGIEFTVEGLKQLKTTNQLNKFREAVEGIQLSLSEVKDIKTLSTKTLKIDGRLMELGAIKAIIENPEFETTYFNISGERVQTFIGTNTLSALFDVFSKLTNIDELRKNPKFRQYAYILTDKFSKGSAVLNKMFNLDPETGDGERIPNTEDLLKPSYVDGTINEQKNKKKESSRLSYKERLVQDLNLNKEGYYMNLVPGDSSIEHAVKMHNEGSAFVTSEGFDNKSYLSIFKDYFMAEVELARDNRRVVGKNKSTDLRFFKSILSPKLHRSIVTKANSKLSPEALYNKYKKEIDADVTAFINRDAQETEALLRAYKVIDYNEDGLIVEGLNLLNKTDGTVMDVTEYNVTQQLKISSVNFMIANIELHKLLYSDPYQYEDELKRIKNFLSPRQPLVHGSEKFTKALNDKYNEGYSESDLGYTDMTREHFRTVTFDDVLSTDELPNYDAPHEETDGGGFITMKANRIFGIRSGEWTDNDEKQYRYDVAYEKRHKGIELSEAEKTLFKKGNPNIKSAYVARKPIASGNKNNDRDYNDIVLDKYALSVLSYRIFHEMNPKSNAVKLYEKMQNESIDYGVFGTGRKVGSEVLTPLYNKDGSFNSTPFENADELANPNVPQTILNIPFSALSVQSEVPSKEKAAVTQGSQITKLATMDFMEAGVPIDYKAELPFDERFAQWTAEKDKSKVSPLYKEIRNNQALLEARIDEGYKVLLEKLGIKESKSGFAITDREKLLKTLKSELLGREVNENIIEAVKGFENEDVIIEATAAYQQIRNILYSIADRNVISPKLTGGMKVQIPSSLLEENRIAIKEDKNGKPVYTSDILKFYKNKDDERVMEIMIGRWFKSPLSDKDLLNYLNNTPEGQKILSGIGFRIPTQKQNSIDHFKIKQFLPEAFSDQVVVPSAIVRKSGSDFDIDKLSIYVKNVFKDLAGKIRLVEYKGSERATREFYDKEFSKNIAKKIAKIEKYDEFRSKMLNIFSKIEALPEVTIETIEASFTEDEYDFYDYHQDLLQEIINQAAEYEINPSTYITNQIESLQEAKAELSSHMLLETALRKNYVDGKYRKSLENAYVQSLQNLVSHPANFDNLVQPNSAKVLQDLEETLRKKLGKEKIDYSYVGNMINRAFMTQLRQNFVSGKRAIGIAAVSQTGHAQNQRTLTYIDIDRLKGNKINDIDKEWLGDGIINFDQYNSMMINGENRATLSMIKAQDGNLISDINSQFIDGFVDVSKDAWVMRMGATPNVVSTWLFLNDIGVPINAIGYFMNQPIIRDYLQDLESSGYSWLFIENNVTAISNKYKVRGAEEVSVSKKMSENSLYKTLGKDVNDMSDAQRLQQQNILLEFLKYAKMAEHKFHVTQGSNFDTATFNDPFLIFKKDQQYKKAQNTIISSVDDLIEKSFVRRIQNVLNKIRDAFSTVLISDRESTDLYKNSIRGIMEGVLLPYVETNDRNFVKISQKAVSDLFDWSVQTDDARGPLNKAIKVVLLGNKSKKSAAKRILAFRDKVKKDPTHPLYDNTILNALKIQSGRAKGSVDNLYVKGKDNKVYDQNKVIAAFREIKENLGSEKGGIYSDLLRLTLLQSGLANSPISFTQLIPYEDFKVLYNETISKLETFPELHKFYDLHVFERNNWNNSEVVPYKKARLIKYTDRLTGFDRWFDPNISNIDFNLKTAHKNGDIPMVINTSIHSPEGRSDFMVYSWEDKISKSERIKRKKTGDRSHIHKGLFKKVYETNENNEIVPLIHTSKPTKKGKVYVNYVYKAINAWGDSYRAQEFYNEPKPSVLDNGFIKIEETFDAVGGRLTSAEVSDEVIADIFNEKTETIVYNDLLIKGKWYKANRVNPVMLKELGHTEAEIETVMNKIPAEQRMDITKGELLEDYSQQTGGPIGKPQIKRPSKKC